MITPYFTTKQIERFWSRVNIPENKEDCWLWQGKPKPNKYGQITIGSKLNNTKQTIGAHVMAWILHFGEIPDGLYVCHHCDTPLCCNPRHLFIGTHQDNMDDKIAKGRQLKGEKHGMARFSHEQIEEIRKRYKPKSKDNNQHALAREYSTTQSHIYRIVHYLNWKS